MHDLRRRLASLDRLRAPDLWDEIELRAAALRDADVLAQDMVAARALHGSAWGTMRLVVAAALLVGLVSAVIAIGAGLVKLPPRPASTPLAAEASSQATPSSSAEPSQGEPLGSIVYNVTQSIEPLPDNCADSAFHPWCTVQRIWIANGDGTGTRELLPDISGDQRALAWTPDGSLILYTDSGCELGFADVDGNTLRTVAGEALDPAVGAGTACDRFSDVTDIAVSPDGMRLAYVITDGATSDRPVTTIAVYDLGTSEFTRLQSTSVTDTGTCVTANEGFNESPVWSPDGTQLLFDRQGIGPLNPAGGCQTEVLVVNADGTGLRVVVPPGPRRNALHARWSPDGSLIAYHYGEWTGDGRPVDIAVVNPDGTGVRQLTTDGLSVSPEWTGDGRILFRRFADSTSENASEVWIMDADGSNLIQLQGDGLAAFVAPTCGACPYAYPTDNPDGMRQPMP